MGKKRHLVNYDKEAIKQLANALSGMRKPIKDGIVPDLTIDISKLEETIKLLSKKEREALEKLWGLVPGTPIHARNFTAKMQKDAALRNLTLSAYAAMETLIRIENMYNYDSQVKVLVDNFVRKMNPNGIEEISAVDAVKYLMIFLVFILGGERVIFEGEDSTISVEEEKGVFDQYTLLHVTWEKTGRMLPDASINMKLLLETLDMFDMKDVIEMKRYVRLPIDKESWKPETPPIKNVRDIRLFKERIFSNGAWDVTSWLIYSQGAEPLDVSQLVNQLANFRRDWSRVSKFETMDCYIKTSAGKKELKCYEVGGLQFTDVYELEALYLNRAFILA